MHASSRRRLPGILFVLSLLCGFSLSAEVPARVDRPCTVETSLWMLANLFPDPPDFYQLCLGYQLDGKSTLLLNGITWKYRAPLGIPMYDSSFDSPEEEYPGYVRAFGLGLGYQRFVWKGLFASVYAIPFLQKFYSSDDRHLRSGFQLYLQAQLGYEIEFFKRRFFMKPALYVNYWPVNTNFPEDFRRKEEAWPNYQLVEPHLNIGYRF
jgi:hypothetical protein